MDDGILDTAGWIIPATPDDLDQILRIEEESFSSPWTRKMFEAELTGNRFARLSCAWVRADDAPEPRLAGYVGFWVIFDEFRLMTLAVHPDLRRRGIGRRLLEGALRDGAANEARRALLEVRVTNHAAIRLYEQLGFRTFAVRARYYTNPVEDALMMGMEPIQVSTACRVTTD